MDDVFHSQQSTVVPEDFDDNGVALPHGFADQFGGDFARRPCSSEETAGAIHGAVHRQPVLHARDVVFMAVTGSRVNGTSSLLQRDVITKNSRGDAIHERMPKIESAQTVAVKAGKCDRAFPTELFRRYRKQIGRDNVNAVTDFDCRIFELRVIGDGEVGRQGPGGGGPDKTENFLSGQGRVQIGGV